MTLKTCAQNNSAHVDGVSNKGNSVHRLMSEDPHQSEQKFIYFSNLIIFQPEGVYLGLHATLTHGPLNRNFISRNFRKISKNVNVKTFIYAIDCPPFLNH